MCDASHSLEDLARLWARPDLAAFYEGGIKPGETPEDPDEIPEDEEGAGAAAHRATPFLIVKDFPRATCCAGPGSQPGISC